MRKKRTLNHPARRQPGKDEGDQDQPVFCAQDAVEDPAAGVEPQNDKDGANDPCYGRAGDDVGLVGLGRVRDELGEELGV